MIRNCGHEPDAIALYTPPWAEGQPFIGPDYTGWFVEGTCEFGQCMEWRCPICHRPRVSAGPIGCPCDRGGFRARLRELWPFRQ